MRMLVEEVTAGPHSHLYRSKQRLWMHVKRTNTLKILNLSPDTDIYHIGLPLQHGSRNIFISVSINSTCTSQLLLQYYKMTPTSQPSHQLIPQIFQTIFVATGCDYISFFSGIGKATFLRYQHAEFISSGKYNLPGTLADVEIKSILGS